jgi:hypothetical protein
MSSVCTTADAGITRWIRPARVVLPLPLRPSTAKTSGRPNCARGPGLSVRASWVSCMTCHGPAAGSPSPRTIAMTAIIAHRQSAAGRASVGPSRPRPASTRSFRLNDETSDEEISRMSRSVGLSSSAVPRLTGEVVTWMVWAGVVQFISSFSVVRESGGLAGAVRAVRTGVHLAGWPVAWLAQMVAVMPSMAGDQSRFRTGRMWRWCRMTLPPRGRSPAPADDRVPARTQTRHGPRSSPTTTARPLVQ